MERTREEQIEVANTIIDQLGGRKFITMTGAKDIFALEEGVSFKVPGTLTKNHINYIKVWLDPSDTYTVEFWKYEKMRGDKISEHSMVYDDQLQSIFTAETGLDTHL
jgi:translation initiation factor IF-1